MVPSLEKELESWSGPVAEPVIKLLPKVLRECMAGGFRSLQGLLSTLDTKLVGLIYCCCVGCWVLEGMDHKLSGYEATGWNVSVHYRERLGKADINIL